LPRSGAAVRKNIPGLFYAKCDHELNTKIEKNSLRFPTVTYTTSNNRQFRRYDFWTTTEWLKLYFGQIAASKKNKFCGCSDGILPLNMNSKKLENSPSFASVIQLHPTNGLDVTEF
jgi:hypothetical protein